MGLIDQRNENLRACALETLGIVIVPSPQHLFRGTAGGTDDCEACPRVVSLSSEVLIGFRYSSDL